MTPGIQREALSLLAELWSLSPDVRLGQLFSHLGFLGESHVGSGLGYIDDDELVAVMHRHKAELLARLQGVSPSVRATGVEFSVSGSPLTPSESASNS